MKSNKLFFFLLFQVVGLQLSAHTYKDSILQAKIDRVLSSSELKHCVVSMSVVDLESGTLTASKNENTAAIPASTLKVLTTLSSIEMLSDSFQFETKVLYSGNIDEEGNLKGNLYLEGGGDPTLGSSKWSEPRLLDNVCNTIIKAIKDNGITCIQGDIISDESIFTSFPISPSWQWNDLGNYYAAGAWGLNIHENEYHLYFDKRNLVGRQPIIKYHSPTIPDLSFSNEVVVDSAGTGDNAYIFGGPYNYKKRIVGTIPQGESTFRIKGSIPDPPIFMAQYLQKKLKKEGIQSEKTKTQFYDKAEKRTEILKLTSPPLDEIVKRANFESNNLYCEAMLKYLGLSYMGQGTGQNGIAGIRKVLRKFKIKHDGLYMQDGSGLSARNNVNSLLLAQFLREFASANGIDHTIRYLPKAGYQGTVRSFMNGYKAKGKVYAKSGSMNRVQCYAGLMQTASGQWKTFAILVNGFATKSSIINTKIEKIIDLIYKN